MTISKQVTDRQKSARAVVAALETHRQAAGEGIGSLFGAEHTPPAMSLMDAMARGLSQRCDALVSADEKHNSELGDDAAPRQRRDDLTGNLYSGVTEFREVTTAIFGSDYARLLGFSGDSPRDPDRLRRLGTRLLENLKQHSPPQPRFAGMCFDSTFWSQRIEQSLTPLSAALDDVAREAREAEATQLAKHKALEDYDALFSKVAKLASAMLDIAGQPELARKVRPSSRRPGRTLGETGAGEVVELPPAPPAGPTGAATPG